MPGAPFVASLLLVVRPGAPSSFLFLGSLKKYKRFQQKCYTRLGKVGSIGYCEEVSHGRHHSPMMKEDAHDACKEVWPMSVKKAMATEDYKPWQC